MNVSHDLKVSVVTVTMKNACGLKDTIDSLLLIENMPYELIVVDGCVNDLATTNIIKEIESKLPVTLVQGKDKGIYDAMNIGKHLVTGDFVHYLNAGDMIVGDPYRMLNDKPFLIPVGFVDGDKRSTPCVSFSIYRHGYCHQGMILPKSHEDYNLDYSIVSDFDMMMTTFPNGMSKLPINNNGSVFYDLNGISSQQRKKRDLEFYLILWRHKKFTYAIIFMIYAFLKYKIPKRLRSFLKWKGIK